jgi:hypothetical protein
MVVKKRVLLWMYTCRLQTRPIGRRDHTLESPGLDLAALSADYKPAGLVCAAADLRRRLEW